MSERKADLCCELFKVAALKPSHGPAGWDGEGCGAFTGWDAGLEGLGQRCSIGCTAVDSGPPPQSQRCPTVCWVMPGMLKQGGSPTLTPEIPFGQSQSSQSYSESCFSEGIS